MFECVCAVLAGKERGEQFKARKGELGGAVHLYKPKNLSSVGSRFLRRGVEVVVTGRTFAPAFGAANDITEIVFVALPGSETPGKVSRSGGHAGRETGKLRRNKQLV